jgi:hypothetical protein
MTSTPTRSVKPTTPTDWTLERLVIQSVAAR